MKRTGVLILLVAAWYMAAAQSTFLEDSLRKELSHARTVPDRLRWMDALGQFYIGINNQQADELEMQIITLADSSRNREWMATAYLYNADRYLNFSSVQLSITKGLEYAQKALEIARNNNLNEWTTWSYLYLARGYIRNGEGDKALDCSNMALSLASGITNDSLQTCVYNILGDAYMAKNEKLPAFRHYLQALDKAEETGIYELLSKCYWRMSDFYSSLEDYEKAKDFLFRREALQLQHNKLYDLLGTYSAMGGLYVNTKQYDQALKYYEKTIALAHSIRFDIYNINSHANIINLYLSSGQFQKGLDYLNTHKDLSVFFDNSGMGYFKDQALGAIYTYMGNLDSAGYYLKKAEPDFDKNVNKWLRYWFYTQFATYYRKKEDYEGAIAYWTKAKTLMEQVGNLNLLQSAAANLDTLYQLKGDYKTAYSYHSLYTQYKDSSQKLSKEKDLLSMEIDNENRRKEREALKLEEATHRRHNIQYMGITIAIAAIFILLVMAGVFSVSKGTIKILGFFAFIFLFEFIIMIADNIIHDLTHGEPWKVLAIKIGLIAILLPLHHWLEEKAIHYLTTQELLRIKGKGLIRKWLRKKDADLPIRNV
jgi:tetratricopeptide (TPR) repeat protein